MIGLIIIVITVTIVIVVTSKKSENNPSDDGKIIKRELDIDKKLLFLADLYNKTNGNPLGTKIEKFKYLEAQDKITHYNIFTSDQHTFAAYVYYENYLGVYDKDF